MIISIEHFKEKSKSGGEARLFCLIAGIRGSGKSTAIGTMQLPTLLIASALESHASMAAKVYGGENIITALYDVGDDDKQLKPDKAIEKLHSILDYLISSKDIFDSIKVVALDSFSAVDKTLLETTRVLQEKNGFEAMKVMEQEHLRIIRKLKELHRRGMHILATMPIMASFDDDGFYVTAKPEIRGVTATSNIAGIFDEVLVVAKYNRQFVFQMDLLFKKVGKEVSGADKQIVFHPRINGLSEQELIGIAGEHLLLPADLNYIYGLKKSKFSTQNGSGNV